MQIKHCKIDPDNCSKEELEVEIERLQKLHDDYDNLQMAIKIFLNSVYGAFANAYYICFDKDLAEAITLQSRDLNFEYTKPKVEKYFYEMFPEDKELHKKLNLINTDPPVEPVVIYGDSIHEDSIINLESGNIKIKDLWNNYNDNNIEDGKEIIYPGNLEVLNYDDKLYYAKVKKLIRHKVSKEKWLLKSKQGQQIYVTGDHSLVVFRDGKKLVVKPKDVLQTDKLLINSNLFYGFSDIEDCKCIGNFNDEYVYDLEMEDSTHTFIANNILVHNTDSQYVVFDEIIRKNDVEDPVQFILDFYEFRLKDYFEKVFEDYGKRTNTENLQNFELEKICDSGLWLGKKHYITADVWKEPGIRFKPGEKFTYKGIEIIRSGTPAYVREILKKSIDIIFERKKNLTQSEFIAIVKKWKEEFKLEKLENICLQIGISDYDKYVLNDRDKFILKKGCPMHTRAAAIHNYMINQKPKYKKKYDLIKSHDKIKYYYAKGQSTDFNVFGFLSRNYPIEINPPAYDYDAMFNRTFLDPINKILLIIYKWELPENLMSIRSLF